MPIEPEQDPTYLSFQRALGFDDADMRAVTAQRKATLFRRQQYRLPKMTDQFDDANQAVDNDFASRGVFGSGIRGQERGTILNRHTRQVGESQLDYVDEVGSLEADLARQIAANKRRMAEQSVEARQRLAMDAATVGQR